MPASPAYLGTAKTVSLLERLCSLIRMSVYTQYCSRHCLQCQSRKTLRPSVWWPILSITLPPQTGVGISVAFFRPLPLTPRGNAYILLLTDHFSRTHARTLRQMRNSPRKGTADILLDKYSPLWSYPVSISSENGLRFCSEISAAILKRPRARIITTNS